MDYVSLGTRASMFDFEQNQNLSFVSNLADKNRAILPLFFVLFVFIEYEKREIEDEKLTNENCYRYAGKF